ncbi:MAG: radical SAM protein [Deltaproteobacteria bacterium]|nr:radical SAM protein [Deltaproteobacteria bacterium]
MTPRRLQFEQGPIRPPNEAQSLLLRFTRNCPWNQCLFCPVYKGRAFALRTVAEIKTDIEAARNIADEIRGVSQQLGCEGTVTDRVISTVLSNPAHSGSYRSVAVWMYYQTGACFLQDADNLIMRTDDMVEMLTFLRRTFPEIKRVTTYSRSRTVTRKPADALKRIREAGLDRVHIGLESGSDAVLKLMKKGVTADQHVEAGHRLIEAGLELSEYVMPGLGGQDLWREHAVETARVLNRINPHFIRLRSLRIPARVPLHARLEDGSFRMLTDDMLAEEIRVFIENLDGVTSTVASDHMMNLLEDVSGKLPGDKPKMLEAVRAYQSLPEPDRLVFRVGRRGGAFRSVRDLARDPATCRKIRSLIDEVQRREGQEGVERMIAEMVDQSI